jgi:hypothetical protein
LSKTQIRASSNVLNRAVLRDRDYWRQRRGGPLVAARPVAPPCPRRPWFLLRGSGSLATLVAVRHASSWLRSQTSAPLVTSAQDLRNSFAKVVITCLEPAQLVRSALEALAGRFSLG